MHTLGRSLPIAAAIALLAGASAGQAATYEVDSTSASASLSACTAAAGDCSFPGALTRIATVGDTISFSVTSTLVTEVEIGRSLTILANGAALPRIRAASSLPTQMTLLVRNARFVNLDSADAPGGAMYIQGNQTVIVEDSEFSFNRSSAPGGAIFSNGPLTLRRCRFEGNYSQRGAGGVHIQPIANTAITPTLTVTDSSFVANGVLNPGTSPLYSQFGAIKSDVSATITGSLFDRNDAQYAAAIQSGAQLRIYNSTFWRNQTRQSTEGGALLLGGFSVILNSTLVENAGSNAGAMTVYPGTDVWVGNTLIANNTGSAPEIDGRIYSQGGNLVRTRGSAQIDGDGSLNLYDVNPRYVALANNGGPTATVALLPTSPAIDAGRDCVLIDGGCDGAPAVGFTTDQRGVGFARKRGLRVDIGAFEVPQLIVTNTANSGAGSLRQTIADAVAGDHIGFDPVVFAQARTIALGGTPLLINKSLSIVGPGAALLTLDGGLGSRHFTVDAPAVQIHRMRLYRGDPGNGVDAGSMLINSGTTTVGELVFELNRARSGGCILTRGTLLGSQLRLTGCTSTAASAAIHIDTTGYLDISDSLIEYSIAGGANGGIGNLGTLVLRRSTLRNNTATLGGGVGNYGTATLNSVTLSTNHANSQGGGGVYNAANGTLHLNHPTITANAAASDGGGLWNDGGTANLSNALIAGNSGAAAPDARGVLRSLGYNLTGDIRGHSWDPGSPSMLGNLPGVAARLGPLSDQGTLGPMHPPLYDSPIIDAGGAGLTLDGRALPRPIDFGTLANASGGNGNDIGAFELQVNTPTNVVATPLNGAISVAFTGGSNDGQTVIGYSVSCGDQTVSGSASPIVVNGLASGTPVSCSVRALSATQTGIESAPSATVVPGTPPGAPTIGTAAAGPAQVSVAFTAPDSDGGSPITGYTASCGSQSQSGAGSPIVVSGLTNGTPVSCSVIASNAIGNSAPSALSNEVSPLGEPGAPTIQSVLPTDGKVTVEFSPPGDTGGTTIIDYAASCADQSTTGSASPLIVGGLSNGVAVTCTVSARNAVGTGAASAPSAPVTPVGAPGSPTITSIVPGDGSLTVQYSAVTQTGGAPILDYELSCLPSLDLVIGSTLTLQLTGLNNHQRYECRVRARNSASYGLPSAPVYAYPAAILSSDLSISLSNQTGYVSGGAAVSYRIVVSNPGPAGVAGARVQDTLDADFSGASWTCQPSPGASCPASGSGNLDQRVDLPIGGSVEFVLTATVAALPETPVSNLASVTPPVPIDDPQLSNNVATDGPDLRGLFRDGFQ